MKTANKADIEKLKAQLLARRDEVREGLLADRGEESGDSSHEVHHGGEEYFETLLKDVGGELSDLHYRELRAIVAALERIELGRYGVCIDCGESIDLKRLQAFPTAKRCIDCKKIFERIQASD